MILFHATLQNFDRFHQKPTWFSLSKDEARGWHSLTANEAGNRTLRCELPEMKMADENDWEPIASQHFGLDSPPIYSMFDARIGEFPAKEIAKFLLELSALGFVGAYMEDYDPTNFERGSTRTLCIFDPSSIVKILGEHKF